MNLELGDTRLIMRVAEKQDVLRNQLAYILATAYWETGRTMKPVKEAYWLSEGWRKNNLRYYPWYGRGYVQLTWEENYKRAARELGLKWTGKPDFALESKYAAEILVRGMIDGWFTKRSLGEFVTLSKSDFKGARRVVNGTDKAKEIADLAKQYDADLKAEGYGETKNETPAPESTSTIWWIELLRKLIGLLR